MEIGHTINVLDHGYIKLIAFMGTDESIIEAARMSTNKGFISWEKDAPLLDYLYRNEHSSPFESCELVVEMMMPIFVCRELVRHRTFSYNELSARYTKMPNLHYLPEKDRIKKQSKITKNTP